MDVRSLLERLRGQDLREHGSALMRGREAPSIPLAFLGPSD
jgi:hypothetical protein